MVARDTAPLRAAPADLRRRARAPRRRVEQAASRSDRDRDRFPRHALVHRPPGVARRRGAEAQTATCLSSPTGNTRTSSPSGYGVTPPLATMFVIASGGSPWGTSRPSRDRRTSRWLAPRMSPLASEAKRLDPPYLLVVICRRGIPSEATSRRRSRTRSGLANTVVGRAMSPPARPRHLMLMASRECSLPAGAGVPTFQPRTSPLGRGAAAAHIIAAAPPGA